MEDAYNLLKDEEDSKNWKVTHQDQQRTMYIMDEKPNLNLKVCKDFKELRKFVSVFKGVNYEKIKDFIGDFGKWITCDTIKSQGGPMSWMNNMREVKRFDEDSYILSLQIDFPVVSGRDLCLYNTSKTIQYRGKEALNFVVKSVDVPEVPENPKFVRANMFRTGILEKLSEDEVRMTAIISMDMRGWFPS